MKSVDMLAFGSYHVVVGNPPYITVKDKEENENYREAIYELLSGSIRLSVPFAERSSSSLSAVLKMAWVQATRSDHSQLVHEARVW